MHPEFPALGDVAYLEHAHRAPLPERARRAVESALLEASRGVLGKPALEAAAAQARANLARILGCAAAEVHFTANTSAAIATVAASVCRPGDRVVTNAAEWPSNIDAWRRPGVEVSVLPLRGDRLDMDDVTRAVQGARVLAVASVSLATGERRDLERLGALARRAGAFFFVDAAQSLGVIRTDVKALGIDALAACSRKWLLGPPEVGILYAPSLELPPRGAEPGPLLAGLAASTGWLLEHGLDRVEREALANARAIDDAATSPIVRVRAALTQEDLAAGGVVARLEPGGVVRFSPHFWTPAEHLERARRLVSGFRSRPGR